jgi:hypothetical protein
VVLDLVHECVKSLWVDADIMSKLIGSMEAVVVKKVDLGGARGRGRLVENAIKVDFVFPSS